MTADGYSTLRYEVSGHKAYVTLNRPDRLNAINDEMPGEIPAAVKRANADPVVRVIMQRGAGRAARVPGRGTPVGPLESMPHPLRIAQWLWHPSQRV